MNLYEHTIIARQDTSPSQLKQLQEKYSKIIENNEGDVVKLENWGLMNLSYLIKKNKKGNYIHFKIKANGKILSELEKNEKIDKNLLKLKAFFSNQESPKFHIKAKTLIEKFNYKEGKELGAKLKEIEEFWIENSFRISDLELKKLINN